MAWEKCITTPFMGAEIVVNCFYNLSLTLSHFNHFNNREHRTCVKKVTTEHNRQGGAVFQIHAFKTRI